jgi:hypothetical protein
MAAFFEEAVIPIEFRFIKMKRTLVIAKGTEWYNTTKSTKYTKKRLERF